MARKNKNKGIDSDNAKARKEDIMQRRKSIGANLNFAGAEAYRLLRTNLSFCLADEEKCKIIGMTSSVPGEGKSTTSINLADSLAQNNKKVLLVEADMRLPTVAAVMNLKKGPGLSQVLAGTAPLSEALYRSTVVDSIYLMPAGDIPPNPSELLSSNRMEKVMKSLTKYFDYIVIDLPPINAVSDGLAVSKLLSGMIMVVRQERCEQEDLAEAIRKMKLMQVKILGFVMTDAKTNKKRYGKYKKSYEYGADAKR